MQALWILGNVDTNERTPELSTHSAREFLSHKPVAEHPSWMAWQVGWPTWRLVSACPELVNDLQSMLIPPPMPPPMPKMTPVVPPPVPLVNVFDRRQARQEETKTADATSKTNSRESKPAEVLTQEQIENRRKHPRHKLRLRVIIRNEEMTFRTFSLDISLGGISLENAVPDQIFAHRCQIFIAGPNGRENLRFFLQPTSRNDLRYFSFDGIEEGLSERLDSWLKLHSKKAA